MQKKMTLSVTWNHKLAVALAAIGTLVQVTAGNLVQYWPFDDGAASTVYWQTLNAAAASQSLLPLRPGKPGGTPFWNANARRFIQRKSLF